MNDKTKEMIQKIKEDAKLAMSGQKSTMIPDAPDHWILESNDDAYDPKELHWNDQVHARSRYERDISLSELFRNHIHLEQTFPIQYLVYFTENEI
ncbi:hypothetical protein O9G_001076 [Rozella allomycis CSF55]|uniref:Uncharacterized protein n=1 Tax=Rozella allomycis (strain CSF55) TaxID=988480 RepID=A0A075AR33_ROZAC|nr:hypothetical protein O9G_001076 [Rozella allomycis CSF55]|eukprot:EPZ31165.1 hypothetical protein O9G_001076 [Rozella allomycis CSF55]